MDAQMWAVSGFVVNLLLGGIVWFIKHSYADLQNSQKELKRELDHVKEHYYRKEDFREFKEELWHRLDKMELNWRDKLNELRQP